MPLSVKVVLICLAALFVIAVAAAGGGYWWWQHHGDALLAQARLIETEGARFATGKDKQACVDEAIIRVRQSGVTSGVKAQLFLTGCLRAARPLAGFCDGVPNRDDDFAKSASWNKQRTEDYGLGPFEGPFVVQTIQRFCTRAAPAAK